MHIKDIIGNENKILKFAERLKLRRETFYIQCEDPFYANFVVSTVCGDLGFSQMSADDFLENDDPRTIILCVGQQRTLLSSKKTNVLVITGKTKNVSSIVSANKQVVISGFTINAVRIVVINCEKTQTGENVLRL